MSISVSPPLLQFYPYDPTGTIIRGIPELSGDPLHKLPGLVMTFTVCDIEAMAIEIVSFPIKNDGDVPSYVSSFTRGYCI